MEQTDFENRIISVLIVGVLNMMSLSKMDQRDGTNNGTNHGTNHVPPYDELLRIELSRVLTTPSLQSSCPEYRDIIDAALAREILCQPWQARERTGSVIRMLSARAVERRGFPMEKFTRLVEYGAIQGDPCVYSIARRGQFLDDEDEIDDIVRACCDHFDHIEDDDHRRAIFEDVDEMYTALRQTLG
jgi:hypothetical protein